MELISGTSASSSFSVITSSFDSFEEGNMPSMKNNFLHQCPSENFSSQLKQSLRDLQSCNSVGLSLFMMWLHACVSEVDDIGGGPKIMGAFLNSENPLLRWSISCDLYSHASPMAAYKDTRLHAWTSTHKPSFKKRLAL